MSHFTVLVIGDDPEAQLAPYHEYECTGVDDEYVVDVDITEKVREQQAKEEGNSLEEALGYHGLEDRVVEDESQVDREGKHKYGYAVVRDGELIKAIDRTNPNAHWDWYQLGGRWNGFFAMKPGTEGETGSPGLMTAPAGENRADQARKGDIDFEGMRAEREAEAREQYQKFHALVGDLPKPRSWDEVREEHAGDIDKAREAYHEQPVIKQLREDRDFIWEDNPGRFYVTEDEFAQVARDRAIMTFAVVKDSQWHQRGDMGWFGCVSDEKNPEAWQQEFTKLLDGLDDDTLLSVYDCHI